MSSTVAKQVALIHTSPSMVPVFKPLCAELLPRGVSVFNMVDESLLCDIIRDGKCPPATARRLVGHVLSAADAGATHVLVTCSSMGRAVDSAATLVPATVLRVDRPMVDKAVSSAARIGVIATLPSTLAPTVELVSTRAAAMKKDVSVESVLVEGAFAAFISGDTATHDTLVGTALASLSQRVEAVILAQASMARVADLLEPAQRRVPIYSSPRPAVEHLATLLA